MKPKGRLIALLTDFGTGDPYVAAMRGVIHSVHPGAEIVDVSHAIRRHDVAQAAYTLRSVEEYFPARTIFVCVVDPGVGTDRRILCLLKAGRLFLAPENGLLNYLSDGNSSERWYSLNAPRRAGGVSSTFHGRDIFAPAAARLARGTPVGALMRPIPPPAAEELFMDLPAKSPSRVVGRVLHIDNFGNIVTNIRMPGRPARALSLSIAGKKIRRVSGTYEDAPPGSPFMIRGSTGLLEVSLRRGDAAAALGVKPGERAVLHG